MEPDRIKQHRGGGIGEHWEGFNVNTGTAQEAGAERGKVIAEYLEELEELTPGQKAQRVKLLRAIAGKARENAAARDFIERLLTVCVKKLHDEPKTFRAAYLDGDARPSARQLSRRLCLDIRSVHRHNRRVLEAMLPPAFGVYGVFQTDSEREQGGSLTEQEREFCRFCALCVDRPEAALVAGYDPPKARRTIAALLKRDEIRAGIQREREAAALAEKKGF